MPQTKFAKNADQCVEQCVAVVDAANRATRNTHQPPDLYQQNALAAIVSAMLAVLTPEQRQKMVVLLNETTL